jgi:hypothetical protein
MQNQNNAGDEIQPEATYGIASLLIVILGPFISLFLGSMFQACDGSGAAWAPVGFYVAVLIFGCMVTCGTFIAYKGLRRSEKWVGLAYLGVALNGIIAITFWILALNVFFEILGNTLR